MKWTKQEILEIIPGLWELYRCGFISKDRIVFWTSVAERMEDGETFEVVGDPFEDKI